MNKHKQSLLELLLIFIITLLFNLLCNEVTHDEVWNYGFAYNIYTGLIPYKDFNMVITALYPMINALILKMFGNSFLTFHIFNAIICTIIFYYMKKQNHKSYYLIYLLLMPYSSPYYSILCLLFLYILMDLEDNHKNDYLLGFILGLTFLTKQNVGIYLCLPTLFIKNYKKIFKRIVGFLIPNIIFLIYLIKNNILYNFIDYCFLGIKSFAKDNLVTEPVGIFLLITSFIYLIIKYFKTKDIKIIYLISFLLFAYPIIDKYHTMIAFIPSLGYFLNNLKLSKKILQISFLVFIIYSFSNSAYLLKYKDYTFPNDINLIKYRIIPHSKYFKEYLDTIITYLDDNKDKKIFITNKNSYLIKLEANLPITKYDLLNDGNLGSSGSTGIINEIENICKNNQCAFLLDEKEVFTQNHEYSQYNTSIMKYIYYKYPKKDTILDLSIYKNY